MDACKDDELRLFQCQRCRTVFPKEPDYIRHKVKCDHDSRTMLLDDLDRLVDLVRRLELQLAKVKRELHNAQKEAHELHEVGNL